MWFNISWTVSALFLDSYQNQMLSFLQYMRTPAYHENIVLQIDREKVRLHLFSNSGSIRSLCISYMSTPIALKFSEVCVWSYEKLNSVLSPLEVGGSSLSGIVTHVNHLNVHAWSSGMLVQFSAGHIFFIYCIVFKEEEEIFVFSFQTVTATVWQQA